MLVLVRRVHEAIKIGDDIVVTVLGHNGNQIRLGVAAPSDVTVHREEVFRRIYGDEHTDKLVGDVTNTVKAMQQQPKAPTAEQQLALEISPLKYGTVVNVPRDKQYGFIYTPGIEKNIFFHASNMADCEFQDIEEGKEVRFRLMYAKQGYFAEEITMMD